MKIETQPSNLYDKVISRHHHQLDETALILDRFTSAVFNKTYNHSSEAISILITPSTIKLFPKPKIHLKTTISLKEI